MRHPQEDDGDHARAHCVERDVENERYEMNGIPLSLVKGVSNTSELLDRCAGE